MSPLKQNVSLPYCEGYLATNVPDQLKKLLPNNVFLQTQTQPGVYILYLPEKNRAYVGQSKNVSFECSMYLTSQRTRQNPEFAEDVIKYRNQFKRYALYLGKDCENVNIRLKLENEIINQIGSICYNIKSNTQTNRPTKPILNNLEINTKLIQSESLTKEYDLNYFALQITLKAGIYIMIHPVTKNFYIGQTNNIYSRIKNHLDNIKYTHRNLTNTNSMDVLCKKYTPIVNDLLEFGSELHFSMIEYFEERDFIKMNEVELKYQQEAYQKYGSRLYNKVKEATSPQTYKKTIEARQLISEAQKGLVKKQDTLPYPVIIDDIFYPSMIEASRQLGYEYRDGPKKRCLSPKYPTYIWLKDPVGKKVKRTPQLEEKTRKFAWIEFKNNGRVWSGYNKIHYDSIQVPFDFKTPSEYTNIFK
jgi:hypothetical protein